MAAPDPYRRQALYRCFDKNGTLLYVGRSSDPEGRMRQHRRGTKAAAWIDYVATVTHEWFDDGLEAKHAEGYAIYHEKPVHNLRGKSDVGGTYSYYESLGAGSGVPYIPPRRHTIYDPVNGIQWPEAASGGAAQS